jgi:hypothetical protein
VREILDNLALNETYRTSGEIVECIRPKKNIHVPFSLQLDKSIGAWSKNPSREHEKTHGTEK